MEFNKEIGRWYDNATLLDDIAYQIYLDKFGYTTYNSYQTILPFSQKSVIFLRKDDEPEYLDCYEKANEYLNIIKRKDKIVKLKKNL